MNLNVIKLLNAELPTNVVPKLSLVGTSKSEVQAWVANLSMLNVGETAKQLYTTLQELLVVDVPDATRFDLVETLRPAIYTIIESLSKHYINQNILLDQRAERIAGLAQQLRVYTAMIYQAVATRTAEATINQTFGVFSLGKKKNLSNLAGQATHRALTELFYLLLESKLLYLPVYKGLWLRLHELFNLAIRAEIGDFSLRDDTQVYGQALTIKQVYLRAIFMSACNTNKLRQTEIKKIGQLSEVWVGLIQISAMPSPQDLLLVDTSIDAPPMYITQLKEIHPSMFYINVQSLLAHFEGLSGNSPKLLNPAEQTLLSAPIRFHLLQTLRAPLERSSERHPHHGTIHLSLGLIGSHYQLAGQQSFDKVIEMQSIATDPANPIIHPTRNTEADLAYNMGSIQDEKARLGATREHLESYQCQIVNVSMGGYCIRWVGTAPNVLRSGELIAIREDNDSTWSIGLIRWVQQQLNTGAEFGVEVLSQRGKACGARVIRQDGSISDFMRTLLLPEVKELNRTTSIIAPILAFKSGHKISIRLGSEEVRAQLTRELVVTQSFSQFEFIVLQPEKLNVHGELSKHTLSSDAIADNLKNQIPASKPKDELDELWSTL